MTKRVQRFALAMLVLGVAGCAQESRFDQSASDAYGGAAIEVSEAAPSALTSFLAYEHTATVRLSADEISARLRETQAACNEGKFGECVVLNVQEEGGDYPSATLGMRLVPQGVEPMIAQASQGAQLGSRSTRAEDLAIVVRDNTLAQARLHKEQERLQEFQGRRDLAVADMIALSKQLAEAQALLEVAEQEGAQHRRRIDTQLLTLHFQRTSTHESGNEIVMALKESGSIVAMGIAWTIRALAFLLPLLVLATALVFVVRRWRRRRRAA